LPFASIVGHEGPRRVLQQAIRSGRVSHAYLFEGAPNVGKALAAKVFAQALTCEAPPEPGECCDRCSLCRAIERGNHPDFLAIDPTTRLELKHDEDEPNGGARETVEIQGSLIPVEAVSRLISHANLKPAKARRKVAIVTSAEAMNDPAANRLLKTLEEPPGDTTIILTTTAAALLLPTIVSRCQLVRFRPVPVSQIEALLRKRFPEADPALVHSVAALSGGRPGWAERLLAHPDTLAIRDRLLDLTAELPSRPMVYCLKAAETITGAAEDWWRATTEGDLSEDLLKKNRDRVLRTKIGELLDILLTWFRDLSLAREGAPGALWINADRADDLTAAARHVVPAAPGEAQRAIREAKESLSGNANLRLTVEVMLTRIWRAMASAQSA
jgi:DNA polymerase-3 subunit delta'